MTLGAWVGLLTTFMLAVMSPGPDFMVVLRSSLRGGKAVGLAAALGVALSTIVWVTGTGLGIAALLNAHSGLATAVHLLGAGFLMFYGVKILRPALANLKELVGASAPDLGDSADGGGVAPSPREALTTAFLTGTVGNPKAVFFYTMLFATLLPPGLPWGYTGILAVVLPVISGAWFSVVAFSASRPTVVAFYRRAQGFIDVCLGVVFVVLGAVLLISAVGH